MFQSRGLYVIPKLILCLSPPSGFATCSFHVKHPASQPKHTYPLVKIQTIIQSASQMISISLMKSFVKFILFQVFWLHWVFVAVRGLSLVAASGRYSSLRCPCFSLRWLLLLRSMGFRRAGFISCGTWDLERRLSSCGAWA